jgi:ABC-type sugar transport system ATPase subunit
MKKENRYMADDDMMKDYILEVKDICKEFPGVAALKNVSIQVKRGTVHALLGENGAGKSTLIKIISGVYCQTSGQIFVNGKKTGKMTPKTAMDLKIAVIHQELNLVPQMSVAENVFVGREMFPYIRQEVGEEVLRLENCSRKGVVKNISFSVKKGEVVGFAGLVGAGRSELARCIFGVDPFEQGKVYVEGEAIEIGSVKKAIEKGIYYTTENRKKTGFSRMELLISI